MPAIPVHHTETYDAPWDGPAEEAKIPNDAGERVLRRMYAWQDPNGDPTTKAAFKFPHHTVTNGTPGAANLAGCRAVLSRVANANIPDGDRAGVRAHAEAHLADAPSASLVVPRRYGHVTKALFERPWAMQPAMLSMITGLVSFRVAGGSLSEEEITQRLAAAAAQNGERNGGAIVNGVAILPMYGMISQRQSLMSDTSGGTSLDQLRSDLHDALNNPQVSAVVFDIDSPGGSVDGVTEFAAELRKARAGSKPIVAQVDTLAASAAYWLAAQMSEIVVTPSGSVGSIGVFAMHEDVSKASDMAGVKTTFISAGKYKTDGNQFEPLSDTARATIQDQVDAFYHMFVADVAAGRKTTIANVDEGYGQGKELLAKEALSAGMIDRIDTLDATVRRLQPAKAPTTSQRRAASATPTSIAALGTRKVQQTWTQRMKEYVK